MNLTYFPEHRCNRPRGIGCSEVFGTLQRLRKSDLSGDFGYAGDGGDGTLIAHLSDGSSITWESERAEIVPQPVGLSISSESCDVGAKRDLGDFRARKTQSHIYYLLWLVQGPLNCS